MAKLSIPDKRMLHVIDILKQKGIIRFRQEFCDAIEMPKQNVRNVKEGIQHFTSLHIMRACKKYNINANWVMGNSEEMFNQKSTIRFISEGNVADKKKTLAKKSK